jgi:1-aminocyclopropane-1-carboxylate deaminase
MEEIERRRIKNEVPKSILKHRDIRADVLRLDVIHPLVSGNKWYKLKKHLEEAASRQVKTIVTFGGAFSNHIVATAAACRMKGLRSSGIIRGEKAKEYSPSLLLAASDGMELIHISREAYKLKEIPDALKKEPYYLIPEGGYGPLGREGAKDILSFDTQSYTHIISAVGTGTTLAGLVEASLKEQHVIGISALKNNHGLQHDINHLLSTGNKDRYTLEHRYHFGGYAKRTNELTGFMNEWFAATGIPSDFVYTAKMFYAFRSLSEQNFFSPGSNILLIHTGGLQGNMSLPKGTLIF